MTEMLPEFWVFGYGSLMWRPGFAYEMRVRATVWGFHRSLCVYSHVHRGTPDRPGLVMGLDRGGLCHGLAYRIAPECWDETLVYLRAREQVTSVYLETLLGARLQTGETVKAIAYVVDRKHPQYAGKLTSERQFDYVNQGQGQSGHCREYVLNTIAHLRETGIRDRRLEELTLRLLPHAQTATA